MDLQIPITLTPLSPPIGYGDKMLLTGSCFTEHIGGALADWKFDTLLNPNGILFDAASVASGLVSYIAPKVYTEADLVFFNELWQSWQHHGSFSRMDKEECLGLINTSQQRAHSFLRKADWLIVTLGSAFSYRLTAGGMPVANCHRAPANSFVKHLMTIDEIVSALDGCLHQLLYFNPGLRVIFTVSPVRHIRDGVIENNRSKARLIESVHRLVGKFDRLSYFPAYELVIDVLRDYRWYDIDMVHPNYGATQFVLEHFTRWGLAGDSRHLLEKVKELVTARRHRPVHPATEAHARFLREQYARASELARQYPFLDLSGELEYFGKNNPIA
jgi:hypothetical protein